jgi:serine/threonine-protein kinase
MTAVLEKRISPPSHVMAGVPAALDAVVMRGLSRDPDARFATAREMAIAVEMAVMPASTRAVGDWVLSLAGPAIQVRADKIAEIERGSTNSGPWTTSNGSSPSRAVMTHIPSDIPPQLDASGGVAVVPSVHLRRPHRGLRRVALVVAVTAIVGAALAWRWRPSSEVHANEPPPVMPALSVASVAPTATSSAPSAVATVDGPTSAPATAVISPASASSTLRTSATTLVRRRPASSAAPSCDPPYTIDSAGIRVANPKCL